jgi:hypothetical protein
MGLLCFRRPITWRISWVLEEGLAFRLFPSPKTRKPGILDPRNALE